MSGKGQIHPAPQSRRSLTRPHSSTNGGIDQARHVLWGSPWEGMTLCELAAALFCSSVQPSETPDAQTVRAAMERTLRRIGGQVSACVQRVASSYGDEPETASQRMRWALVTVEAAIGQARAAA